jgi:membrane-bound lytic murein transglycosylase D
MMAPLRQTVLTLAWGVLVALTVSGCATQNLPLQTAGADSATSSKATTVQAAPASGSASSGVAAATPGDARPARPGTPDIPSDPLKPITAAQAAGMGVAQLAAPADLWERIRRGYAMPNLQSDLVADREQYYAARPEYITRMTERSRKYMFHIVEELERRNMPSALALLPFIESAFNPQAVSSAKAAGMWQFMPATGKHFELKQNAFRDDRRDVLASTRAALDYLHKLHGMFGDWHLALAAYNWGEGSVGRAIAKNKRAGLGTGYLDLPMPAETRLYVPKLQAMKNIVSAPGAFKSTLPLIENHPFFQTVTILNDIDLTLAAKLAEVSVDDFKALNPSANRPVLLAAGTPQILLPWDQAEVFQRNLKAYSGARLASWTVWTAPNNLKTADAAKRAGMAEDELRAVNHIPPNSIIKAGSTLLVPRSARVEQDVALAVADHGQVGHSPDIVTRRTVVKAGKGESVASLAKRYRLTPASIAEWNKVNAGAAFTKGQQVVLFLPTKMGKAAKANTLAKAGGGRAKPASATKHARQASSKSTKLARR